MTDDDPTQLVDLDDLDAYRIDTSLRPWRNGTQVGRTVYADSDPGVSRSGHLIGTMDSADDAAFVCALVNAWPRLRDELRAHRAREART